MYKIKSLLLDRSKKISYIRNKIKNHISFSGGNNEIINKLNIINENVSSSFELKENIKKIDNKLEEYQNNFSKLLEIIDNTEKKNIGSLEIKKKTVENLNFIANLNSREKYNYDGANFTDNEYINSLNIYFVELVKKFKSLKLNNMNDYDLYVEDELKKLLKKVSELNEEIKMYKNKNKAINADFIKFIEISESEITYELKKENIIINCDDNNDKIITIKKVEKIVPVDLSFLSEFIVKINKLFDQKKISFDKNKIENDKRELQTITNEILKLSPLQKGGNFIKFNSKVELLFKLEKELQTCNVLLQEINANNKKNLFISEQIKSTITIISELFGKEIKKKFLFVDNEDINLFLSKLNVLKNKTSNNEHDNNFYLNLENIFKIINKNLNEKKCLNISKIDNNELKKAFALFNIIMFEE